MHTCKRLKLAYFWNYLSIPTKFCTAMIQTTKWPSWMGGPNTCITNQDGERPSSWKKNIEKSPYRSNGSTDLDEIWHSDAGWPSWPFWLSRIWNFEIWKFNMAACRNICGGCIKYWLRNLSVLEFGQFDSDILYKDTQPKYKIAHITHKIAHITHLKIRQILTGEDGPLKLGFTWIYMYNACYIILYNFVLF